MKVYINEAIEVEKVDLKMDYEISSYPNFEYGQGIVSTTYFDNSLDAFSHSYNTPMTT